MNEIDISLPFDQNDIDRENYTLSLLKLCSLNGIMPEQKQLEIKKSLDDEFTETAEQYTKRESSSLSMKRAELIYSSVLYQSDVSLLSMKNDNSAVKALLTLPMIEIINRGKSCILSLIEETKKIFKKAFAMRLDINIDEYTYVMYKAFDEFLQRYSARFDARNINTTIDYPLLGRYAYELKTQGIMFMHEYYTGIMLENEFCRYFNKFDIVHLLECYGKMYNLNYEDLLFNLSEVLLNNMLSCAMLERYDFNLEISYEDCVLLHQKYILYDYLDVEKSVKKAFANYYGKIKNPQLFQYLRKYIHEFSNEFFNHINDDNIDKFIIITK